LFNDPMRDSVVKQSAEPPGEAVKGHK
jgi:hypothetical protein